jgi:hypothetical protein
LSPAEHDFPRERAKIPSRRSGNALLNSDDDESHYRHALWQEVRPVTETSVRNDSRLDVGFAIQAVTDDMERNE